MLILVAGGAASGKSEYAESLALLCREPRVYLATMQVTDREGRRRVERHRMLRQGKGFETVECPFDLAQVEVPIGSVVLLECLSNLLANECFDGRGFEGAVDRILDGIDALAARASHVIVVTNEMFSDGMEYNLVIGRYMAMLTGLNCVIAEMADQVVEVCCGIPILYGRGPTGQVAKGAREGLVIE